MTNDVTRTYPVRSGYGAQQASNELGQMLNEWLERNGAPGIFRTCATCKSMAYQGPAICAKFNQPPPIDIVMRGCDAYEDMSDIPM